MHSRTMCATALLRMQLPFLVILNAGGAGFTAWRGASPKRDETSKTPSLIGRQAETRIEMSVVSRGSLSPGPVVLPESHTTSTEQPSRKKLGNFEVNFLYSPKRAETSKTPSLIGRRAEITTTQTGASSFYQDNNPTQQQPLASTEISSLAPITTITTPLPSAALHDQQDLVPYPHQPSANVPIVTR
jgi:hypothetical protein